MPQTRRRAGQAKTQEESNPKQPLKKEPAKKVAPRSKSSVQASKASSRARAASSSKKIDDHPPSVSPSKRRQEDAKMKVSEGSRSPSKSPSKAPSRAPSKSPSKSPSPIKSKVAEKVKGAVDQKPNGRSRAGAASKSPAQQPTSKTAPKTAASKKPAAASKSPAAKPSKKAAPVKKKKKRFDDSESEESEFDIGAEEESSDEFLDEDDFSEEEDFSEGEANEEENPPKKAESKPLGFADSGSDDEPQVDKQSSSSSAAGKRKKKTKKRRYGEFRNLQLGEDNKMYGQFTNTEGVDLPSPRGITEKRRKVNGGEVETKKVSLLKERKSDRKKRRPTDDGEEDDFEIDEEASSRIQEIGAATRSTRRAMKEEDSPVKRRTRGLFTKTDRDGSAQRGSPVKSDREKPPARKSARPQRARRPPVDIMQEPAAAALQEEEEEESDDGGDPLKNCLKGLTIVVTGQFQSITRDKVESMIKQYGGRNTGSVSGKTTHLIAGYKLEDGRETCTSGKYRKATALKVPILDEVGFQQLIREKSGVEDFKVGSRNDILKSLGDEVGKDEKPQLRKSLTLGEDGQMQMSNIMWTDLYQPETINDLVGNEGSVNSLFEWLRDWDDVHVRGHKKEVKGNIFRFSRNWADMPRLNAKAAMVSGPPGIGKTSAVRIVARHLGFEVLELNASDSRSKLHVQGLIGTLSGNKSLDYWTNRSLERQEELKENETVQEYGGHLTHKSVIVMDEVDGCGSGDRGGITALIQIIKQTNCPIVCICNDRQNRKLASLLNHCLDLKFQKPTLLDIKARVKAIAENEGLSLDDAALENIIMSSGGGDIRQVLNMLQMWRNFSMGSDSSFLNNIKKDNHIMITNFDAAYRLLNCGEKPLDETYPRFRDKLDLFFIDYDFIPLLVQDSYLNSMKERNSLEDIETMADAAEMISFGDQMNVQLRQNQNWSLLPNIGVFSAIGPATLIKGHSLYPAFPQWLGKNSTARKAKRLIRELKQAMRMSVSSSKYAIQNEVVPFLTQTVLTHLKKNSKESIEQLLAFMDDIGISNELFKEHLLTLSLSDKHSEDFKKLAPATKSNFTRLYNKMHQDIIKITGKGKKGSSAKNSQATGDDEEGSDGSDLSEEEEAGVVLDEEEMKEMKLAKKREREMKKAQAAMKRIEKLQKITEVKPGSRKLPKKPRKAPAKKPAKKKKGGRKNKTHYDESGEDELKSDDSLNDFVVDDDVDD